MPTIRTPFIGPAYVEARGLNFADAQLINLYPEFAEGPGAKGTGTFYMTPGLILDETVGNGPVRGMGVLNGVMYVVSGNAIYPVIQSTTSTETDIYPSIGTIGTNSGRVSFVSGQNQMAVFDGAGGHLISTSASGQIGTLSTINLPFSSPVMGAYQDGFGLAFPSDSNQLWQSNALDLSTWSPLAFSTADANAENIVAITSIHREVWVFKSTTTEVWDDVGSNNFAFQRNEGVYIEVGCAAPWSVAQAGEFLIFLAQTKMGNLRVCMMEGYRPVFISTASIEQQFDAGAQLGDAFAYAYEQKGHVFYVLTFPTLNQTWVYDLSESAKVGAPVWHRRASFANGAFNRELVNCYQFYNGYWWVGDYTNGNLYNLADDWPYDNGAARKWLRSWRALPKPSEQPVTFHSLRIDMQTGTPLNQGAPYSDNPQVMLRWSDDGGHTWSVPRLGAVGAIGQTARRVKFNRLGSTRRNHGLDRIFELSSTDQFFVSLMGAELEAS